MKRTLRALLGGTILAIGLCLVHCSTSHAQDILKKTQLFDDEAVASTGSATTAIFDNSKASGVESLLLVCTAAGQTCDVKVELVICTDTSETVCGTAADFTDLEDSTNTDCPVSQGLCRILMPVVGAPAFKLTVTGVNSNHASSTVDLWVVHRGVVR